MSLEDQLQYSGYRQGIDPKGGVNSVIDEKKPNIGNDFDMLLFVMALIFLESISHLVSLFMYFREYMSSTSFFLVVCNLAIYLRNFAYL